MVKTLSPILVAASLFLTGLSSLNVNATSKITVHNGDNLAGLSNKYHVSRTSLEMANHLNNRSTLKIGQKLILPNSTDQNTETHNQNRQNTDDSHQLSPSNKDSSLSPTEQSAKNWIAYHESRGNYHVSNGIYYGRYELNANLLHGNYSDANQERAANKYVHQRYGTWNQAKKFWEAHNWY